MTDQPCPFCEIVAGRAPATVVHEWSDVIAIVPLNPVVEGHTLVIPRAHVDDAATDPDITAATMLRGAELAAASQSSNILTSIGKAATQSVFHLHIHVVPRAPGDQLMLPWGTTGNPHDPHWCKVAQGLQDQADAIAHELAEKIRTTVPPTAITPGGPYTDGVTWAADLIDPATAPPVQCPAPEEQQ